MFITRAKPGRVYIWVWVCVCEQLIVHRGKRTSGQFRDYICSVRGVPQPLLIFYTRIPATSLQQPKFHTMLNWHWSPSRGSNLGPLRDSASAPRLLLSRRKKLTVFTMYLYFYRDLGWKRIFVMPGNWSNCAHLFLEWKPYELWLII